MTNSRMPLLVHWLVPKQGKRDENRKFLFKSPFIFMVLFLFEVIIKNFNFSASIGINIFFEI